MLSTTLFLALIVVAAASDHDCGPNEEWTPCTGCEVKCGASIGMCPRNCRPPSCECHAAKGLRRTPEGKCVPEAECPKRMLKRESHECKENEKWTECGGCEGTCKQRLVPCVRMCKPPKCECVAGEGFVRDAEGKCIKFDNCPK